MKFHLYKNIVILSNVNFLKELSKQRNFKIEFFKLMCTSTHHFKFDDEIIYFTFGRDAILNNPVIRNTLSKSIS